MSEAAKEFRRMLDWNHELAGQLDTRGFPLAAFERLQRWQRQRLERSYADFMAQESAAPACRFFLQELYGGMNFRRRDQEVARVAPVMIRMLPDNALTSVAEALRLQGMSLELDMGMARLLHREQVERLDQQIYGEIYRECGRRSEREQQIELIRILGHDLERLVAMPLLRKMVRMMRRPAVAAGFAAIQTFLEEGIAAFHRLEDAADFVDAIHRREWQSMMRLFAAESDPFGFGNAP